MLGVTVVCVIIFLHMHSQQLGETVTVMCLIISLHTHSQQLLLEGIGMVPEVCFDKQLWAH